MNGCNPFGYEDKPGTCLWCGRKLRVERYGPDHGKTGRYGLGLFHADSCAVLFAHELAQNGYRVRAAKP